MDFDRIRDTYPQPGTDPVDRLKHVNALYAEDSNVSPNGHALDASYGLYGKGVWTGLTYGDLQKLENRITLGVTAERVKIVDYVRDLARRVESDSNMDRGIRIAMAALYQDLADKINSYQDEA